MIIRNFVPSFNGKFAKQFKIGGLKFRRARHHRAQKRKGIFR